MDHPSDFSDCEDMLTVAKSTPKVAALLAAISNGGDADAIKIQCRSCSILGPEGRAKALIEKNPIQIILCKNRLFSHKDMQRALTHELVHLYDYSRKRCDFTSCDGLAYSEVRAAREGEFAAEGKGLLSKWLRRYSVRRHAIRSTANLFPDSPDSCVDRVFHEAYNDCSPFERDDL
mmetsp:Transcript_37462/g.38147  ORF Transcript_37462/g.38147 Transcript_37462/m.38147 type:complete len:176 (-) Transcript_37462:476-1003(-)